MISEIVGLASTIVVNGNPVCHRLERVPREAAGPVLLASLLRIRVVWRRSLRSAWSARVCLACLLAWELEVSRSNFPPQPPAMRQPRGRLFSFNQSGVLQTAARLFKLRPDHPRCLECWTSIPISKVILSSACELAVSSR